MMSTGPAGRMVTVAVAFGKQVFAPALTTMLNVVESSSFGAAVSDGAVIISPSAAEAARTCSFINIILFSM